MTMQLFVDLMSQPCRALAIFMKLSKIPFQMKLVAMRKGEHKQEPFLKLNPLGKVPVLVDGDFILTESVAIFRYLCHKHYVPDYLYPSEIQAQAKVDEYMEWQHMNARFKASKVFIGEVIARGAVNIPDAVKEMNVMLDQLQFMFLKDQRFLTGDKVSFADILAICELMQPTMSGRDVLGDRPKLKAWAERVKRDTQPYFDEVHAPFYRARENVVKRRNKL